METHWFGNVFDVFRRSFRSTIVMCSQQASAMETRWLSNDFNLIVVPWHVFEPGSGHFNSLTQVAKRYRSEGEREGERGHSPRHQGFTAHTFSFFNLAFFLSFLSPRLSAVIGVLSAAAALSPYLFFVLPASPLVCLCDRRFAWSAFCSPLLPCLLPNQPRHRHDYHTFKPQWKRFKNRKLPRLQHLIVGGRGGAQNSFPSSPLLQEDFTVRPPLHSPSRRLHSNPSPSTRLQEDMLVPPLSTILQEDFLVHSPPT